MKSLTPCQKKITTTPPSPPPTTATTTQKCRIPALFWVESGFPKHTPYILRPKV